MKKIACLSILLTVVFTSSVFAEVYTESSSYHRVYYRDGAQGEGSYSTHYSRYDEGNPLMASVAGYVGDRADIAIDISGTGAPRVAEAVGYFDSEIHVHNHGDY